MFDKKPRKIKKIGEFIGILLPYFVMVSILYHILFRFNIKPEWLTYQIILIIAVVVYIIIAVITYLKNEKRQIIF